MGGWNIWFALINFAILVFFLVKFGKKIVINMIEGNRQKISQELDKAKEAGENARQITQTLENMDAESRSQCDEILVQARERSKRSMERSVEESRSRADSRLKEAEHDVTSLKQQALTQLRGPERREPGPGDRQAAEKRQVCPGAQRHAPALCGAAGTDAGAHRKRYCKAPLGRQPSARSCGTPRLWMRLCSRG